MTTLDPRALEAAVEVLCRQIMGPRSNMGNVGIRNATRFRDEARAILDAYLDATQPTITTVEELEGLEDGTVVLDSHREELINLPEGWYCIAHNETALPHEDIALPARVIWSPHEGA